MSARSAHRNINSIIPAITAAAVTPHDSNTFAVCRALYVGGTGNMTVRFPDGTSVAFVGVPAGILPIQVVGVNSTDLTASSIVALY